MFEHLSPQSHSVLLAVFAALALASLASISLVWRFPDRDYTELRARIRTWWVIAGLVAGCLLLSPIAAVWFLAFVSFLGLKEFFTLIPSRRADRRIMFWAYVAIPVQYALVANGAEGLFLVFLPVYVQLLLPARMILIGQTDGFLRSIGTLTWGLTVTVFFLSHAAFLLVMEVGDFPRIEPHPSEVPPGPALFLLLLVLTQCNDVLQYLWGKTIGRRKLAPTVSPGKTWGGFLGGLITTIVLASILGPWLTILDLPRSLMVGALTAVAGVLGDLNFSALKRDLGVKDASAALPGHGGVLDRVDSLIFTAPVVFHLVNYCYG